MDQPFKVGDVIRLKPLWGRNLGPEATVVSIGVHDQSVLCQWEDEQGTHERFYADASSLMLVRHALAEPEHRNLET